MSPRPQIRRLAATVVLAVVGTLAAPLATPAAGDDVAAGAILTPGDFTGYGFDQCLAPTQKSMNRWLKSSPFLAVGIYISGTSRACRSQPNLTPTWISAQLTKGWRLLPITLGPQASCQPRFPRYSDDVTIDPTPGADKSYSAALAQGLAEASTTVADAQAFGIPAGSALWYDLEGFDLTNTACRESALRFLSGWTTRLHELGYVSGVYSSAGSGIKMLDDARVDRPGLIVLPDRIWVARWDGVADTSTSYLREDGWRPGGRVKQYVGGHDETWGGVTINIDRNYLDLGAGSVAAPENHCGGVRVDYAKYPKVSGTSASKRAKALRCLLGEQGYPVGRSTTAEKRGLPPAMQSWQQAHGFAVTSAWQRKHWVALLAAGDRPVQKVGSAGPGVYRVQRALNAAGTPRLPVTGVFDVATDAAVRAWQKQAGLPVTGVIAANSWKRLQRGER
ncbi:MAG: glycoside hydrolase domain-containing protein [Nocardioides sp.]